MSPQTVFLAGVIGWRVVPLLVAAGHRVTAWAAQPASERSWKGWRATVAAALSRELPRDVVHS